MICNKIYNVIWSVLFTACAFLNTILIATLYNQSMVNIASSIFGFYCLEKIATLRMKLSNNLFPPKKIDYLSLTSELMDLDHLKNSIFDKQTKLHTNIDQLTIKIFIRFFFLAWVYEAFLFQAPSFNELSQSVQIISILSYYLIVILIAYAQYAFNNYNYEIKKYYFFFSQFCCTLLQTTTYYGLRYLFLSSFNSILLLIFIKFIVGSAICFLVLPHQFELYNLSEKYSKMIWSYIIVFVSYASDHGPFEKYGLSNNPDCLKIRKMSSQESIVIIRGLMFIESVFIFILISFNKPEIQEQLIYSIILRITAIAFIFNTILTVIHLNKRIKCKQTNNYTYFSTLSLDISQAYQIISSSQDFIFISIYWVKRRFDLRFNAIEENNLIEQHTNLLQDKINESLWQKIFIPIPQIGFRKINYTNIFYLKNEEVVFCPASFFFLFCNFFQFSAQLVPRMLVFKNTFIDERIKQNNLEDLIKTIKIKDDQWLTFSKKMILFRCLVERLFTFGCCKYTPQCFALKSALAIAIISDFKSKILQISSVLNIIASNCSVHPGMILYDLYDN